MEILSRFVHYTGIYGICVPLGNKMDFLAVLKKSTAILNTESMYLIRCLKVAL